MGGEAGWGKRGGEAAGRVARHVRSPLPLRPHIGCWCRYIELKVVDGDTRIGCPEVGCKLRVPEEVVARLCPVSVTQRYRHFMAQSFVDDSRSAAWCPHPGCGLAVDVGGGGGFVRCAAGHDFCSACRHPEAHAPAPCDVVKTWLKKARRGGAGLEARAASMKVRKS